MTLEDHLKQKGAAKEDFSFAAPFLRPNEDSPAWSEKMAGMKSSLPAFNDALHVFQSPTLTTVVTEAVQFFSDIPDHPLPPTDKFIGAGVYGLYYRGPFKPYAPMASVNQSVCERPIYIGKAVPQGSRTARKNVSSSSELRSRLTEHARNIRSANNLDLKDFRCRFMILHAPESDLIGTVESALIRHYLPLWNSGIDGFGNHPPGRGRYNQSPSHWDVLHPGRGFVSLLTGVPPTMDYVLERVSLHLSKAP